MMWSARDDRLFIPIIVALIGLAWLALVVWKQSPYGRYLHHDNLAGGEFSLNAGRFALFVAGWALMIIAMMLPTTLPLVAIFRRMTAHRLDRRQVMALLVGGYLGVWLAFGILIYLVDLVIHQMVDDVAWLAANAWVIGAGTFLLAGVYQFTPLKYHCLDRCRSPMIFIKSYWTGQTPSAEALKLGAHHGFYCVVCCWSLMLLMFGIGVGNVGWMLALGAVMAIEKNMSWGRQISTPIGVGLLATGIALAPIVPFG